MAEPPRVPTPVVGFDELWAAWPAKRQRPKAKDAYKKLAPDAELHGQMVVAAQTWAAAYEEHSTDLKWCPLLHNWIVGERWLEDAPPAYEDPKTAAIANRRGSKSKARRDAAAANDELARVGQVPCGSYIARIVTSEVHGDGTDKEYMLLKCEITEGKHEGCKVSEQIKLGKAYSRKKPI